MPMDEAFNPVKACRQKKRYVTEELAGKVIAQVWALRGTPLRSYACEDCGGFHLTSKNAEPPAYNPAWRPPRVSARDQARQRKRDRARGKKRGRH